MNTHELGLSFRSEPQTIQIVKETAEQYGMQTDFLGVYDDLGDMPSILPLYEAATHLPKHAKTRIGAVGFAIPKHPTMIDIAGYISSLNNVLQNPNRIIAGLVPGAWMGEIGLKSATVQQTREAVETLKHLLSQNEDGYVGKYFSIKPGFALNYPTQETPILLGAWGEKMGALAGEIADEIKIGGSSNPQMVRVMKDHLAVGANRIGRDINDIRIVLGAVTVIDEDGEKARAISKRKAVIYINVIGDKDPTALEDYFDEIQEIKKAMIHGNIDEAVKYLPEDLSRRFIIAGTPKDIIAQTREMFEAGASRVEFGTPHGLANTYDDEMKGVELLVNKVFPYFR
jgi:5,10-methylenetetrahydromethanopterin reductase